MTITNEYDACVFDYYEVIVEYGVLIIIVISSSQK